MALPATEPRVKTQADIDAEKLLNTAQQRAIEARPTEMAEFLQALVGQKLTAYMTGSSDANTVGKWASGERRPQGESLGKLREAYHIALLLTLGESEDTARAWLVGMNPILNHQAPAAVIAELPDGGKRAMGAARAYLAHG